MKLLKNVHVDSLIGGVRIYSEDPDEPMFTITKHALEKDDLLIIKTAAFLQCRYEYRRMEDPEDALLFSFDLFTLVNGRRFNVKTDMESYDFIGALSSESGFNAFPKQEKLS